MWLSVLCLSILFNTSTDQTIENCGQNRIILINKNPKTKIKFLAPQWNIMEESYSWNKLNINTSIKDVTRKGQVGRAHPENLPVHV